MSQTAKIVLGVIIVAALAALGYWYWQMREAPPAASSAAAANVTTLPSGAAASDAAIGQDLNSIDTQLNAVHSDNTSASQSVNAAVQ